MLTGLYLLVMFSFFIVPFYIFELTGWFHFGLAVLVVFILAEGVAYWRTGKTLTQQFGTLDTKNKWITTGCMVMFWALLIIHLWY